MLDLILNRTTVIGLAVIGGVLSLLAAWLRSKGEKTAQYVKWLDKASYAFMAVSIILFIGAGMFGTGE